MLPNLTDYMGAWPKALAQFLLLIIGGHFIAVFVFGTEFLSIAGLLGNVVVAIAIGVIAYRQKRAQRNKFN